MEVALGFLYTMVIIGGSLLTIAVVLRGEKLKQFSNEIKRLKERVSTLELDQQADFTGQTSPQKKKQQQQPDNIAAEQPSYNAPLSTPAPTSITKPTPDPIPSQESASSSEKRQKEAEKQQNEKEQKKAAKKANKMKPLLARPFLEGLQKNWIGIIGMAFFVLGFGFLGLYPSAKIAGLQKFILFAICSSAMFIATYFTAKMPNWRNLSLWMRSGASAIFLFACIGSAIIPGFIWVEDSITQIILLIIGIGINLLAGYTGKTQLIALVHVIFSLIALAVVPATETTIVIATLVTGFGIFLTYRKKWDINLLIVISLFFIFHLYWHFKLPIASSGIQLWGFASTFVILVAALLTHYRKVYAVKKFSTLPFLTHFINWIYFGIGVAIYFEIIPQKAIIFLAIGLSSYLISRRGKRLNIRWLFITDAMVAYFFVFLAIITINRPELTPFMIAAILFIEAILFLFVVSCEKESILVKIGYALATIFGFVLVGSYLLNVVFETDSIFNLEKSPMYLNSMIMIICLLFSGFLFYMSYIKEKSLFSLVDRKIESIISVLFSLMITVTYFKYINQVWCLWALLALVAPLIYLRHRWKPLGNTIGLIILTTAVSIGSWAVLGSKSVIGFNFLKDAISPVLYKALYIIPLFIGLIGAIKFSGKKNDTLETKSIQINKNGFVLIATTINFLVISYILFNNISSFIPGIIWLLAIPLNLEMAHSLKPALQTKRYSLIPDQIRNINYIIFASYLMRHLLVHLQSELLIGGIFRARLLMELFTIGVLIYWMIRNKSEGERKRFLLDNISKVLLEVLYFFIILTASVELSAIWLPGFWIAMAISTLILSLKIEKLPSRMRLYSLFFAWISFFHLAFVNNVVDIQNYRGLPVKWISAGVTFAIQIVFIILLKKLDPLHYVLFGKKNSFPKHIRKHINKWAFYPFFVAIAIFIGVSFNSSIITLSLIVESLIIFILSLAFKENGFRYLSLAGIAGCLIRLIFVDLFNSDMFIRAIVFIGVGVAMLLMNTLYLKFGKPKKEAKPQEQESLS